MIVLRNLSKRFGTFTAVDGISLQVNTGSIFAFLGTNGAGKTTTIRMVTGVLEPTSGEIEVGGHRLSEQPLRAKRLMGVVPDRAYVYGKLTGREYLLFIADLYRLDRKSAAVTIDELLERFELTNWQFDMIETYSHGMKQRIVMCGALVHDPPVLVVDEPMIGLDPPGAKLLKDVFRERARAGKTVFMSTHTLSVAEEIADHLGVIKRGKLLASGTLEELYLLSASGSAGQSLENLFLELIAGPGGTQELQ